MAPNICPRSLRALFNRYLPLKTNILFAFGLLFTFYCLLNIKMTVIDTSSVDTNFYVNAPGDSSSDATPTSRGHAQNKDSKKSWVGGAPLERKAWLEVENLKNIIGRVEKMKMGRRKKYLQYNDQLNLHDEEDEESLETWQIFQNRISRYAVYSEADNDDVISPLLRKLSDDVIVDILDMSDQGTQIKFVMILQNKMKALFKPKRVSRDSEETLDIYYMYETERHTGEIAAYHLDRLLKFYSVPPVSGRYIDMISELKIYLSKSLQKKFFYSPIENLCFYGKCTYFCDAAHSVCGDGTQLEGSMAAYVPGRSMRTQIKNPWGRSYSKYNKTVWESRETGSTYCEAVRQEHPYNNDTHMLNLIDMHIFDFLIGNKDRHHYHLFKKFGNISNFLLLDNGKGFGRYTHDIHDILAPLYQCCLIRLSTLDKLISMHVSSAQEAWLSSQMRQSLSKDSLNEVLTEGHLKALDRRLDKVISEVNFCAKKNPDRQVVIDDGFYINRKG